jgi:hypothetical protein
MIVKTWKIHPKACRLEKAEKTCMGLANSGGIQWCAPYTNANKSGFWIYSPIEMDLTYDGDKFEVHNAEEYGSDDYEKVKSLIKPTDQCCVEKWCFPNIGRTKTTFGLVEKNVVQIWTGLIFETPPGWCLHVRSPVNFPRNNFEITEAILETDWMQYDIWLNIACQKGRIKISKDLPIAQIVPTRRETFKEEWILESETINRNTPEAERVFTYWLDYNKQKFEMGGRQQLTEKLTKDSTTYFKERNRIIGQGMEPERKKCPYAMKSTLEEDLQQYREESKPKVDFFPVFEKDKTKELRIIANAKETHCE